MKFKKLIEIGTVIDIGDKGRAVCKTETNKIVFTDGVVPGDIVELIIYKKRKGNFEGFVSEILDQSPYRTQPVCQHFGICGGCKWQNLNYEKQLELKDNQVKEALTRIGKAEIGQILPIKACDHLYFYRNKLEFSFSTKRWLTKEEVLSEDKFENQNVLGFHAPSNFEKIIPIESCHLQPYPSNEIRNYIYQFTQQNNYSYWDTKLHTGLMRNIILRTNSKSEAMVIISFAINDKKKIVPLLDSLTKAFPAIKSLNYVINPKFNDSIFDLEVINYRGEKYLKEQLGTKTFLISPKSFFQTNSIQSKLLYDIMVGFAEFKGNETVLELYTGIGSIAIYISDKVKKVIGIEIIPEAIQDAVLNAQLNEIQNVDFIAGDVKDVLKDINDQFDIIIVDPPRAGLDKQVTEKMIELRPEKILYISCNPSTQARDIEILRNHYDVQKSQAVDMFPQTHHVENVVLMIKK